MNDLYTRYGDIPNHPPINIPEPRSHSWLWLIPLAALLIIVTGLLAYSKGIDKGAALRDASFKKAVFSHAPIELEGKRYISVWHKEER